MVKASFSGCMLFPSNKHREDRADGWGGGGGGREIRGEGVNQV